MMAVRSFLLRLLLFMAAVQLASSSRPRLRTRAAQTDKVISQCIRVMIKR
jgi:hypothetical protein